MEGYPQDGHEVLPAERRRTISNMSDTLRSATKEFLEEHPYAVDGAHRGSAFPPVEAGFHHEGTDEMDTPAGGTNEMDNHAEDRKESLCPSGASFDSPSASGTPSAGVVWHAKVMSDDYANPKHCMPSGELKPKRGVPHIKVSELLSRLKQEDDGHWILPGPLNGWPALHDLELRSLTCAVDHLGFTSIKRIWNADEGKALPAASEIPKRTRATFVAPSWTRMGWSAESLGFVWWYSEQRAGRPAIMHGEKMLTELKEGPYAAAKATMVHHFVHRYPVENPSLRDQQTWHAGLLVEWEHGQFVSEIEMAYLNAVGGYGGKANWVEDKLASVPNIYAVMLDRMKAPWDDTRTEIRLYDMPAKTKDEFLAYLTKYSEKGGLPLSEQRFELPVVNSSSRIRLSSRTQADIAGYLLNYQARVVRYELLTSNCQTFAADFYSFLAGDESFHPYGTLIRAQYTKRSKAFLYEPNYNRD